MFNARKALALAGMLVLAVASVSLLLPNSPRAPVAVDPPTLLLIPVDSRPVNTQHVELLAKMAGFEVLLPPPELMDYYTHPADKDGLLQWLETTSERADYLIVATDSIFAGGLVASRHPDSYASWEQRMDSIRSILQKSSDKTVVFLSVMPRLLPTQFANPGWQYRQQLSRVAQLTDKLKQDKANAAEQLELRQLEHSLPAGIVQDYRAVYEHDRAINNNLLAMVNEGLIDQLVLTLDDAASYGFSNLNQRELMQQAGQMSIAERVSALTGADETSMLILARLVNQVLGFQPTFRTNYESPADADLLLRYESASLDRSISEKIAFIGATTSNQAVNQLFIHARPGTARIAATVDRITEASGQIGVIDVAHINLADSEFVDALFEQVGADAIHSYAGWNTASNSIGSVIAHLSIRDAMSHQLDTTESRLLHIAEADLQYRFLHIADEVVYLARAKTQLISWLRQQGIADYQIPESKRDLVNDKLLQLMRNPVLDWVHRFTGTFTYKVHADKAQQVTVTDWEWEVALPWPRVFEVQVIPKPIIP